MPALLAALALSATQGAVAPEGEAERKPLHVAVTRDGVRVQCAPETTAGALRVCTPFGDYPTPTDPVERIDDGAADRHRLRGLRLASSSGFPAWLRECTDAGLLEELAEGCERALAEDAGHLDVFHALELWGLRLDPAPRGLSAAERVEWLWKELHRASPARGILLSARLVDELSPSRQARFERQLTIADLREALRSSMAHVRRTAARAVGRQGNIDLFEQVLRLSTADPAQAVREAACWAATQLHGFDARQYWTLVLARADDDDRLAAAQALGWQGGEPAADALAHVLSAWKQPNPCRYTFAGREIQVVRDRVAAKVTGAYGRSSATRERLELGSVFKVTVLSNRVTIATVHALAQACPDGPESLEPEAWLSWYEARRKARRP